MRSRGDGGTVLIGRPIAWKPIIYQPIFWIPIALALIVGGCAGGLDRAPKINEIVLNDVQQAGFMAARSGDTLASLCWDYLEQLVADRVAIAGIPEDELAKDRFAGVLSVYQKARDVRRLVRVEVSDAFKLACGPMLLDSAGALGRLGIRIL